MFRVAIRVANGLRRGPAYALMAAGLALASHPAGAFQLDRERQSYRVSEFVLEYALDHPAHLDLDDIAELEVGLRSTERGFVAPRPVDRTYRMALGGVPENARFYPSALQHINWFIVLSYPTSRRAPDATCGSPATRSFASASGPDASPTSPPWRTASASPS